MEALRNLNRFPESGRVIPEFPDLGFREVLVGKHRFFYRLQGDAVWVVGVWHDAQIPDEPA
jgi:plasmid stabilization system protein ParE